MFQRILVWLKLVPNLFIFIWFMIRKLSLKKLAKNYRKHGEIVYTNSERYKKLVKLCKSVFKMTWTKIEIVGEENIPEKSVLFTPNHRSTADPIVMMVAIDKIKKAKKYPIFVAKKELQKSRYGIALELSDSLFLDRDNIRQALQLFQQGADYIREGRSVVVFPEGTRNKTHYGVSSFKPGAFKMAYQAHAPIVPVTIVGSEVPFKRYLLSSKNTVKVIFHKPIAPLSFINIDSKQLAKRVENIVLTSYKEHMPYAEENGVFEEERQLKTELNKKLKDIHPQMNAPYESQEISVETIKPISKRIKNKIKTRKTNKNKKR